MFKVFQIAGSGLFAQKRRLDIVALNLANALTTRVEGGGPYRRKSVVTMEAVKRGIRGESIPLGTRIAGVMEDNSPPRKVYEPSHPDADEEGFVAYPGFSPVQEMAEMMESTRSFEANLTVISESKSLFMRTLEMGRGL